MKSKFYEAEDDESGRAEREAVVPLTLAEVEDVQRGGGWEFGTVTTYRHTEMQSDGGELRERYESVPQLLARLAAERWEPVSVVPDEEGTWITCYLRRRQDFKFSNVGG